MSGETLRKLREAKSWSQAHLAQAADLNIRTVQRIEAGEPCSYETMLSLAAALGADVGQLELESRPASAEHTVSAARVGLAVIAVAPAALFVMVNLLRTVMGVTAPYDFFASSGTKLIDFETFNKVSPVIFLGGAAVALAISLPGIVRVRGKVERGALVLSAIELRAKAAPLLVSSLAVLSAVALLAYAALEQLHSPIS